MNNASCPDCGHPWSSHQGAHQHYVKCMYRAYADYVCPCTNMDPRVAAENDLARAAWNAYMGRA